MTRKRVLRDSDWTEITDQNFAEHRDWYIETGTLQIGETVYVFHDLNF